VSLLLAYLAGLATPPLALVALHAYGRRALRRGYGR